MPLIYLGVFTLLFSPDQLWQWGLKALSELTMLWDIADVEITGLSRVPSVCLQA